MDASKPAQHKFLSQRNTNTMLNRNRKRIHEIFYSDSLICKYCRLSMDKYSTKAPWQLCNDSVIRVKLINTKDFEEKLIVKHILWFVLCTFQVHLQLVHKLKIEVWIICTQNWMCWWSVYRLLHEMYSYGRILLPHNVHKISIILSM